MLHHDNYILFYVNIQAVVVFHHKKVKFTNCLLNAECIFVMAESDKTLIQDCNLSNNTPNNIVSSINPMHVGTIHSDTHPSHQVACEPSTLKRKQTSFQITSVTVKGSRLSTDGGEDSADDLDESHTEDANSENLDSSRTTDLDKEQMLEDNTNNDVALIPAPSIPIVSNVDLPIKQVNKPFDAPKNDPCENTQSDFVKPSNLPDQWQHRFKVVKIVSSEPFKRGRWLCLDFMDPPAPVTEAKAEIVESSSSNIQLIAKSLPDSIPSDKIAHIYEISPSDAYPGSISVAVGSDHAQQPMYGIFLPISNGQYPLITGMHSRAIPHSNETEVKSQETSQPSITTDLGIQQPKKLTPPLAQQQPSAINLQTNLNVLSNTQQSQSTISSNIQQRSQVSNTMQQPLTIGLNVHQNAVSSIQQQQQQQSDSSRQQQNVASVISQQGTTSNMHIQQNVPTNIQQQSHQQAQSIPSNVQNIELQQNVSTCLQQPQNIQTNLQQTQLTSINHSQAPTVSNSTIQHIQSISSTASQPQAVNMPSSNNSNVQQTQQVSVNISQSKSGPSSNVQQSQFISSSIPQPQQLPMNMQTMSGIHQSQQISGNLQQTQNLPHPQHAGLQQQQNVPTNEQQNISANPQQSVALNVPSPQHSMISVQQQTILSGQPVTRQTVATLVLQKPVDSEVCVGETLAFPTIAQPLLLHGTQETHLTMQHGVQATNVSMSSQTQNLPESEMSHSLTNIPENSHSSASIKTETVVPSQGFQNHMEARDAPPLVNVQVSQELVSENLPVKGDANGEESENVSSGTSTVAIDNKIEQAMDLVKSHLMFAVREEVDVLKEKITELMDRISQLEYENGFLRANASQQTLEQLNQTQLLQQQQQQQQQNNQPSSVSAASTTSTQQLNFQNQQPTS